MIIGFILIIIGVVFLLQNLGYISGESWSIIWPAILIVIGFWILFKRRDHGFFLAPLENLWKKKTKKSSEGS